MENLDFYTPIAESIKKRDKWKKKDIDSSFSSEENFCSLLIVEEGEYTLQTSWRENKDSFDITAAITLKEGFFVLLLPGERYIIRGKGKASLYILE